MSAEMSSRDYYFDSYSHFGIHEEMLKDEVRTMSYRNAIYRNRHLFEGKVVLDVGCGTGILCMFAAQAGAKLVIGVDMSGMLENAKKIVAENGFADRIVLLKGKMEEVQLPVDKVDIIISEWMGYFLLYESMLDTVLWARDRYLAADGLILPDRATIRLAALEDAEYKEQKIHFWDDVYGFRMSCLKEQALHEPLVDTVESRAVVSHAQTLFEIDIYTVTREQLAWQAPINLTMIRSDHVHAFVSWFDIYFEGRKGGSFRPIHFGTGPYDKYTHWKQTVLYLPRDLAVAEGDVVLGHITCRPNAVNPRDLDISLDYSHADQSYHLDYHMC